MKPSHPVNQSTRLMPLQGVCLVLFALSLTKPLAAFSGQAPAGYTGAPPGGLTCAACHTGSGSGRLNLDFGDGTLRYVPGETYSLSLLIEDSGQSRFGFSMTSRQDSAANVSAGSWTAGTNSAVYDGGKHIGHSGAPFVNDRHTFEVMWTAPPQDVGSITFYAVGNAANGNFSNGPGDNIYTRQLTIRPAEAPVSFWSASVLVNGWRNSGEAYPELIGIGWIFDAAWPWVFTYAHAGDGGDWIYIFTELGDRNAFWGYNFSKGYYFRGDATIGWYFSYENGNEGWFKYES